MNKENKTVSQWELTSLGSALVTHPLTADSSIFHNHCNRCEAFGRCVGDKTEGHCNQCGKHNSVGEAGEDIPHSDIKPLNLNFNSFIRDKAKIKEIVMSKLILQQEFVYN